MNFPAPQNLKAFDAVRPGAAGVDLASGPLRPAPLGDAGRYAQAPKGEHDQLVDKTRTWVAQTFFGTLLKQMRDSPFKSDLFSGGQGGQAFAQLQDQHLSEHMSRGAGAKLVNGIVRRIEANAAYRKQAVDKTGKADNRPENRPDDLPDDRRHGDSRQQRTHVATALRA